MTRSYTPRQIADDLLSGKFTRDSAFVPLVEVERLRAENARLRAQIAEYFREPATHPVEEA